MKKSDLKRTGWMIIGGVMILGGLVLLLAGQAKTAVLARSAADVAGGDNTTFLPVVSKFVAPSSIVMVPYASGFETDTVTDIAHAGDGRLYVVEREGRIRIVEPNGTILPTPFLDIRSRVAKDNWEQGLLGLAFHPDYPNSPYFYVAYTRKSSYKIYVSRFTVDMNNPDVVDGSTDNELELLKIEKTPEGDGVSPVHNGGDLNFGPDGYLYVGFGDGGPDPHFGSTDPHDPGNNGQRTNTLLGKIVRIDVNPNTPGNLPRDCGNTDPVSLSNYSIPPDNPYVGQEGCNEIWATGLRNPWRFSFDPLTGDMYIGDVGEWIFEEVDFMPAGVSDYNFGWRCWEGTFDQTTPGTGHPIYADRCEPASAYDFPIFEYSSNGDCAVTGGYVYRGSQYDSLYGFYLFGDFCTGNLWVAKRDKNGNFTTLPMNPAGFMVSTFGVDVNGELYAGSFGGKADTIYRVTVP